MHFRNTATKKREKIEEKDCFCQIEIFKFFLAELAMLIQFTHFSKNTANVNSYPFRYKVKVP